MIFHGEKNAARATIHAGVAHDLGELAIRLRSEGLLESEPGDAIPCIHQSGKDVIVNETVEIEFACAGPAGFVIGDGASGGVAEVEGGALRSTHSGPDYGALDDRIGEADFAFSGESIAEQNVSLHVDAVGIKSFAGRIPEGAAIAFEIVTDLSAEKIDFSFGEKTSAEKDEAANVETVGIQCGGPRIFENASIACEIVTDLRAGQVHFAFGDKAVVQEDVAFDSDAVRIEGETGGIFEFAAIAFEIAVDGGTEQAHLAFGGKTIAKEDAALYAHAITTKSAAAGIGEGTVVTFEIAADFRAEQTDFAFGDEGIAEEQAAPNADAIGANGLASGVPEAAGAAVEIAANARAQQLDFTLRAEAVAQENSALHFGAFGVDGANEAAAEIDGGNAQKAELGFLAQGATTKSNGKTHANEGEIEGAFDARTVGLNATRINEIARIAIDTQPANEGGTNVAIGGPGIGFKRIVGGIEIFWGGTAPSGFAERHRNEEFAFGFA